MSPRPGVVMRLLRRLGVEMAAGLGEREDGGGGMSAEPEGGGGGMSPEERRASLSRFL